MLTPAPSRNPTIRFNFPGRTECFAKSDSLGSDDRRHVSGRPSDGASAAEVPERL